MPKEFPDTGIIVPTDADKHPSAGWWNTLGATTSAAIVAMRSSVLASTTAMVDALRATTVSKAEAEQYGIPGPPGEGLPGGPGPAGPIGPGGSIALVETSPGCFVESPVTWMQWGAVAGKTVSAWNPGTQAYELIYGDTGERSVTSLITPAPLSGAVRLSRTGNAVQLEFDALVLQAEVASFINLTGLLPVGFRPPRTQYFNTASITTAETVSGVRTQTSGLVTVYTVAANEAQRGIFRWRTNDAWPTTLPGVAA